MLWNSWNAWNYNLTNPNFRNVWDLKLSKKWSFGGVYINCGFVTVWVCTKVNTAPEALGASNLKDIHCKYPFGFRETLPAKLFECEILERINSRDLSTTAFIYNTLPSACCINYLKTLEKSFVTKVTGFIEISFVCPLFSYVFPFNHTFQKNNYMCIVYSMKWEIFTKLKKYWYKMSFIIEK